MKRRGRFFIDQIFTNKNELEDEENSYLTNKSQDNFFVYFKLMMMNVRK